VYIHARVCNTTCPLQITDFKKMCVPAINIHSCHKNGRDKTSSLTSYNLICVAERAQGCYTPPRPIKRIFSCAVTLTRKIPHLITYSSLRAKPAPCKRPNYSKKNRGGKTPSLAKSEMMGLLV
jgi:hypothetical protein